MVLQIRPPRLCENASTWTHSTVGCGTSASSPAASSNASPCQAVLGGLPPAPHPWRRRRTPAAAATSGVAAWGRLPVSPRRESSPTCKRQRHRGYVPTAPRCRASGRTNLRSNGGTPLPQWRRHTGSSCGNGRMVWRRSPRPHIMGLCLDRDPGVWLQIYHDATICIYIDDGRRQPVLMRVGVIIHCLVSLVLPCPL